jgi:hypothetical protein
MNPLNQSLKRPYTFIEIPNKQYGRYEYKVIQCIIVIPVPNEGHTRASSSAKGTQKKAGQTADIFGKVE